MSIENNLRGVAVAAMCMLSAVAWAGESIPLRNFTVALADRFWEANQINTPARLGAGDLAKKISLTCGGQVKFVRESDAPATGPVLYLGPTEAAKRMGVDVAGFAALEHEIKCDGTNVCVAARTSIGTCATRAGNFYPFRWDGMLATGRYFQDCDGFEKDPNWFDFWASAKTDGKTEFRVDRVIARRIPCPENAEELRAQQAKRFGRAD